MLELAGREGPDEAGRSIFGAGLGAASRLGSVGAGVLGSMTSSFEFGLTILIAELPFLRLGVWNAEGVDEGAGVEGVGVPAFTAEAGRSDIAEPERDMLEAVGACKFGF